MAVHDLEPHPLTLQKLAVPITGKPSGKVVFHKPCILSELGLVMEACQLLV